MSKIIDWLKEPMPKGETHERYFIELKDRSTIKIDKANGHIIRDGFFIVSSKDLGSIMVNVSEIKAVYTNLCVCVEYASKEKIDCKVDGKAIISSLGRQRSTVDRTS